MMFTNILLTFILFVLCVIAMFTSGLPIPKATDELFDILNYIKNKLK